MVDWVSFLVRSFQRLLKWYICCFSCFNAQHLKSCAEDKKNSQWIIRQWK